MVPDESEYIQLIDVRCVLLPCFGTHVIYFVNQEDNWLCLIVDMGYEFQLEGARGSIGIITHG